MAGAAVLSGYQKRFFKKKDSKPWPVVGKKYRHKEVMTDGVWEKMRDQEGDQKEDG